MNVISVPLTQGQVARIDAADWPLVRDRSWFAVRTAWGYYAATNVRVESGKQKRVYMHRHLLGLGGGRQVVVDHKNHDGLDNRRANIWACSSSANGRNRRAKLGKADFSGTTKNGDGWTARISLYGERVTLGTYDTQEAAGIAFAAASRVLRELEARHGIA
jgi:hypothetical protein